MSRVLVAYLIEPRLHDLGRLLRQIAAFACLALLVVVMTRHEECWLCILVSQSVIDVWCMQPAAVHVVFF